MKRVASLALGVLAFSSLVFLTSTSAIAADINVEGVFKISLNTSTLPQPTEESGCTPIDYSFISARKQNVYLTITNAYGPAIASHGFYTEATSGRGFFNVCPQNDFTGPLSFNIQLINYEPGSSTYGSVDSETSHPFKYLPVTATPVTPAPVTPAPVTPAPVTPAPISSATKEESTGKASEEPNTENAAKPTQDNSLDKTETQSPAAGLSPISILLYSFLGTALALGSGALAWKTFARTVSKKGK